LSTTADWESIFENAFEKVKGQVKRNHANLKPTELSPNDKALSSAINSLPCPVGILEVTVDNKVYEHLKNEICQLIYYDLQNIGTKQVNYFGMISEASKEAIAFAVAKCFPVSTDDASQLAERLTEDFRAIGFNLNDDSYIQFTLYDIKLNIDKFNKDLFFLFASSFAPYLINRFKTEKDIDFNTIYQLKNDPIVGAEDFLKPDSRCEYFTIEYLESNIADIQLIPEVPEPVRKVFRYAKDLYVFAYFRYEWFTLSCHYALLAWEAAVKQRYVQSLNRKATITSDDTNRFSELTDPTYYQITDRIFELKRQKIMFKKIKVNGQPFPESMNQLIEWLIKSGVVKEWKRSYGNAAKDLRNSLSHLEFVSIYPPGTANGMLRRIAYDINELFAKRT